MNQGARAAWLPPLAGLVGERLGLDFPPERWPDLERCMRAAALESGGEDPDAFAQRLLGAAPDNRQLEALAHALTIGETYFFREPRSFDVLEREILPPLIEARRTAGRSLRLWSTGCCTGEEAYSLAIVVDRLLPQREDWHVTILATDVNPRFLRLASRGEYGAWSFRDAPPGLKERYFREAGKERFEIDPRIRRMVKFAALNLAEPCYPNWANNTHSMDLILCRNVLMYFSPLPMQQVLCRLERALVDGGWLSVSATEMSVRGLHSLAPIHFDGVVFYRKGALPTAAAPAAPQRMALEPLPLVAEPAAPEVAEAPAAAAAPAAESDAPDVLQLARMQANAGRLDLARQTIEAAIAGAAKLDAGAHHLHAVILAELGHEPPARAAFRRALYLEPGFVLAHHALGQLALQHGSRADAERHFGNALALLLRLPAGAVLPHSDGLAAGHLRALIEAALPKRRSA